MSSYPLIEVVLPVLRYHNTSPPLSPAMKPPPPAAAAAHPQEPLTCPRCDSVNTKFCYYNNYSLSQPRYFCKSCRRYWTKGGTLRNVPVGGGCRKNKKSSFYSTSPVFASSKKPCPAPQDNFASHDPSVLGFLDILMSGNPAAGGPRGQLFYGGDDVVMLPCISSSIMAEATSNAGDNSSYRGGYWNGFFNGFTHEIHDGA